nr:hypothetical protein [Williamsia maris]
MSALEVASSFVEPPAFRALAGVDHCYLIGPRGSGKTTLLKMLQGESLSAWQGRNANAVREQVRYSAIFLPADELWASQTSNSNGHAAFVAQMLYSFIETVLYRTGETESDEAVHLPAKLTPEQESLFVQQCAEAWGLELRTYTLIGMLNAIDLFLLRLVDGTGPGTQLGAGGGIALLLFGIRAFNRVTGQLNHRWALLLDEMEIAPRAIHEEVVGFVRGGAGNLILKLSMSPFDRYMHSFGVHGGPIPGHDFQTFYLTGLARREIWRFTNGLWNEALHSRGLAHTSLAKALGNSLIVQENSLRDAKAQENVLRQVLRRAVADDRSFASWIDRQDIDIESFDNLTYNRRSATLRKIFPLLVFRQSVMRFVNGRPVGRSRKKTFEPFTGASAVVTALEGNPRWIKSAFSQMLDYYDERTNSVSAGFQYDALDGLANRFEALLRVLPRRNGEQTDALPVTALVDRVATYFHEQNTAQFSADPQNCFTVDGNTDSTVLDALVMGLYAGAFVQVRDRRSSAVLSDFRGQRFRLAYLLGVREGKEFPLRLGKDAKLQSILADLSKPRHTTHRTDESRSVAPEQLGFDQI